MTREYWANFILCIFLAIVAIFAVTRFGTVLTPKGLLVSEPEPSEEASSLLPDVHLLQFGLFQGDNNQITADFYIRNDSGRDVKNVNVQCEFFDENGKYLDREEWILYHTFPAGTEERFATVSDVFINTGGRGPVDCKVTDLALVREPFFKLHRSAGSHGSDEGAETHSGSTGSH